MRFCEVKQTDRPNQHGRKSTTEVLPLLGDKLDPLGGTLYMLTIETKSDMSQ